MATYFQSIIPEYEQLRQLHELIVLKTTFKNRVILLGAAIKEAHDRISSGRYSSVNELIELRNAIPLGEKRLQHFEEVRSLVEKDFEELVYLLN